MYSMSDGVKIAVAQKKKYLWNHPTNIGFSRKFVVFVPPILIKRIIALRYYYLFCTLEI